MAGLLHLEVKLGERVKNVKIVSNQFLSLESGTAPTFRNPPLTLKLEKRWNWGDRIQV